MACSGLSVAQIAQSNDANTEWLAAFNESRIRPSDQLKAERLETATQALRQWRDNLGARFNHASQQQIERFELLDFRLAEAWANAGDYSKALAYLEKEASEYINARGRFLDNTRNQSAFAQDVFLLHSEIMAHTGITSPIPGTGYEAFDVSEKDGPRVFAFVHEPIESDEGGVAIEGIGKDEQRMMIDLSAGDATGRYGITDSAQVIGGRDDIGIVPRTMNGRTILHLTGISKFIEYKGDFRIPVVRESPVGSFDLKINAGQIEQPVEAVKRMNVSELGQNQTSRNISELSDSVPKPSPATPSNSTTWVILAGGIVTFVSLLGFFLMKRK